jgi:hypothetical protein
MDDLDLSTDEDYPARHEHGEDAADQMLNAVLAADGRWQTGVDPLELDSRRWKPHLVREDGTVCHLQVSSHVAQPWRIRIEVARARGVPVALAAPAAEWLSLELLALANQLDLQPVVLDFASDTWTATPYRSTAELISDRDIAVTQDLGEFGRTILQRVYSAETNHDKGWRFEDFLCFVFSQVRDFRVMDHNYRNDTEEIDVVIENRRATSSNWPAGPIVLVSAKNMADAVGVPALNDLEAKMSFRNGLCKLGFLCASRDIASTVSTHALRYSREDFVIVLLDGKALEDMLRPGLDLDAEVRKRVLDAALA